MIEVVTTFILKNGRAVVTSHFNTIDAELEQAGHLELGGMGSIPGEDPPIRGASAANYVCGVLISKLRFPYARLKVSTIGFVEFSSE